MTISQRIFSILKEKQKKQKELAEYAGISETAVSDWKKKGTNPSADKISVIADFLEVSTDYLLTGKEKNHNNITNSMIGAMGDNSTGTVHIQKNDNSQKDELTEEILRILNSLPLKERSKLLTIIYDFEETYIKNNPQ